MLAFMVLLGYIGYLAYTMLLQIIIDWIMQFYDGRKWVIKLENIANQVEIVSIVDDPSKLKTY
jgi:hypothetical protein